MSQLVSRILLAIFVFPVAAIFYLVVFIVLEEGGIGRQMGGYRNRESFAFLVSGLLTWSGVAAYWWLLWRSSVKWSRSRIIWTFVSAVLAAIVGALIGTMCASMLPGGGEFGMFVGTVIAMLLWLIISVFLWKETRAERAARLTSTINGITCPVCGYNLTGLNESRCPECGTKFTLDELLAKQPTQVVDIT